MTVLTRRAFIAGGAGAVLHPMALPLGVTTTYAAEGADALIIVLADLHSAYRRLPGVLVAIDTVLARHRGVPTLAVINGDLFERGNTVALRSGGAADLAFLRALAGRLPVIVNLGNHETALVDDMAEVVRSLEASGAQVVTSLGDRRSGKTFAPPHRVLAQGGRRFTVAGIGTDDMATYRPPARALIEAPAPVAWAQANLPKMLAGADIPLVLSHAGVQPDRDILPLLPDGTLLVGGHDHLRFAHQTGATLYLHSGSYLSGFVAIAVESRAGRRTYRAATLEPDSATGDRETLEGIERLSRQHLTEAERRVAATLPSALPLGAAARRLVRAMARSAGADVGLINHTTLGAGFGAGPITAHDLAAFIRFDGTLFRGDIDAAGLAALLEAANQDGDMPLARRSGDFLYAQAPPPVAGRRYAIVTNGWVKLNAGRYLGRDDLDFTELPHRTVRAAFEEALKSG